jgi:hypothetical protein
MEATGYTEWLERLVGELGQELWVGDAAEIGAGAVRRQKTDTRDAEHLLELLVSKRFPRVRVPRAEERDIRQLLKHGDKLVKMQTWVRNQLHFLAMSQGVCRKRRVWSAPGRRELQGLRLGPWASRRGQELVDLLEGLGPRIEELDRELERRGHRLVRYADDGNIYVRSARAGERVRESVTRFITKRLRLKVNSQKSAVARAQERKFLVPLRGIHREWGAETAHRAQGPDPVQATSVGTDVAKRGSELGGAGARTDLLPPRMAELFPVLPNSLGAREPGFVDAAPAAVGAVGTVEAGGKAMGGAGKTPSESRLGEGNRAEQPRSVAAQP